MAELLQWFHASYLNISLSRGGKRELASSHPFLDTLRKLWLLAYWSKLNQMPIFNQPLWPGECCAVSDIGLDFLDWSLCRVGEKIPSSGAGSQVIFPTSSWPHGCIRWKGGKDAGATSTVSIWGFVAFVAQQSGGWDVWWEVCRHSWSEPREGDLLLLCDQSPHHYRKNKWPPRWPPGQTSQG